ncbi:MAG: hypothetical protein ACE15B_18525 [Bryobacteraceae bacterium]
MRPVLLLALLCACAYSQKKIYPERWVYVSRPLRSDADVEDIRRIARTAAGHGLNGMQLAAGVDRIDIAPPEYLDRLARVKKICDENKLELIPSGFNVGYGGAVLAHDRNLAAGMPVKGALFIARGGEAVFAPDSPAFDGGPLVKVKPYRCYRVRWRSRRQSPEARGFSLRAVAPDNRNLLYFESSLGEEPRDFTWGFNSWYAEEVRIQAPPGFTLENLRVEEVGLLNVVRREGTPVAVRDEASGTVYREGRDYAPIADPGLNFRFDRPSPAIRLLPGGRIREGARLRVDYYHGLTIYRDQVCADISEPKVYEIWRKQFPLIEKHLAPKRYFLNFDEVRVSGFCETCRKRNLSAAQMLGEAITSLYRMIREVNPKAEIFVWSDMLDPNHNSRPKYYLVDGDFTGSWNYVPKDLRIACWYFERREKSLAHFSSLGFKTLAGSYYDADDLRNPEGWLEALDATPGAMGIMYTTWRNKYTLLPAFGDLVSKRP